MLRHPLFAAFLKPPFVAAHGAKRNAKRLGDLRVWPPLFEHPVQSVARLAGQHGGPAAELAPGANLALAEVVGTSLAPFVSHLTGCPLFPHGLSLLRTRAYGKPKVCLTL